MIDMVTGTGAVGGLVYCYLVQGTTMAISNGFSALASKQKPECLEDELH